jgi:hypothetical protein
MQKHPTFVPLFTSKVPKIESRRDTLSKTGRTARNLRPDSYGTLAHHRNQDLLSMLRLQDLHDKKGTDHNDFLCIKKKKRITTTFYALKRKEQIIIHMTDSKNKILV